MTSDTSSSSEAPSLTGAFKLVDRISEEEYRVDLKGLLGDPERDDEAQMARAARLMGVVAKQPFSHPSGADPLQTATGTQREWHLDGALFTQADKRNSWQFGTLEILWREQDPGSPSVENFALNAHHEMGFFRFMGRSLRGHICANAEAAATVSSAVDNIRRAGPFDPSSPQAIISASTSSLATYLATTLILAGGSHLSPRRSVDLPSCEPGPEGVLSMDGAAGRKFPTGRRMVTSGLGCSIADSAFGRSVFPL